MNNEEKILTALGALTDSVSAINTRLDGIDQRLDGMDKRLDGMEEDIAEIKEDAAITRAAANHLVEWADRVGSVVGIPVASFS